MKDELIYEIVLKIIQYSIAINKEYLLTGKGRIEHLEPEEIKRFIQIYETESSLCQPSPA